MDTNNSTFDPNSIAILNGNYFALPFTPENASLVIVPVPWDVTTSYREGTSLAPQQMVEASAQIDLYDTTFGNIWEKGIATDNTLHNKILDWSKKNRSIARKVIRNLEKGVNPTNPKITKLTTLVNQSSEQLNQHIYTQTKQHLDNNKIVAIVGGEHSVPFGFIKAINEKYNDFSILHFDAHADLRNAYEGFHYSHASIFYNVKTYLNPNIPLTQVGIRDFCEEELLFAQQNNITQFTSETLQQQLFEGKTWQTVVTEIINTLSNNVYISFDIDVLEPYLCPNTGTPVPGGLSYAQIIYLFTLLGKQKKKIIGFDLCEVGKENTLTGGLDANIGARILYKLSLLALYSQK